MYKVLFYIIIISQRLYHYFIQMTLYHVPLRLKSCCYTIIQNTKHMLRYKKEIPKDKELGIDTAQVKYVV